jgi:hypothetical protein
MKDFSVLASNEVIAKTIESLKANGINAIAVENAEEAKKKIFEMLPQECGNS